MAQTHETTPRPWWQRLRRWLRRWRCTHEWVPSGAYDETCGRCGAPRNLFKY